MYSLVLSVVVLRAIMGAGRLGIAATLTIFLYAIAYVHAVVDQDLAFVNHPLSKPSKFAQGSTSKSSCHMETARRTPSRNQAPVQSRSPWFTLRSHRSHRRAASNKFMMSTAQQTALSSSGFWASPRKQEVSVLQLPLLQDPDVAVVWFTACDLRTHDHDALVASAGAAGVVPLYVFDDQVRVSVSICLLYTSPSPRD